MAAKSKPASNAVFELYERSEINGVKLPEIQRRKFNSVYLMRSRVARDMVAAQGWKKVVGSAVGVEQPKPKAKPAKAEEQFETV